MRRWPFGDCILGLAIFQADPVRRLDSRIDRLRSSCQRTSCADGYSTRSALPERDNHHTLGLLQCSLCKSRVRRLMRMGVIPWTQKMKRFLPPSWRYPRIAFSSWTIAHEVEQLSE